MQVFDLATFRDLCARIEAVVRSPLITSGACEVMMGTDEPTGWYGPTDKWPDHDKTWFRDALELARANGWYLKKFQGRSAHSWGRAYCSPPEKEPSPCKFLIYSTGTAGETAAGELKNLVIRCRHRTDSPLMQAAKRLALIDALISAATRLLDRLRYAAKFAANYERATELLELAELETGEIERLIEEGDRYQRLADEAGAEAESALADAGIDERSVEGLVDVAEELADEVKHNIRQLPQSAQVKALKERLKAVQAKLRDLRDRLNLARTDDV